MSTGILIMFKFFVNFKGIDGIGTGSTICIIGKGFQKLCILQNSIRCFLLHVSSYHLMTSIAGLTCEKMAWLFNVTTNLKITVIVMTCLLLWHIGCMDWVCCQRFVRRYNEADLGVGMLLLDLVCPHIKQCQLQLRLRRNGHSALCSACHATCTFVSLSRWTCWWWGCT